MEYPQRIIKQVYHKAIIMYTYMGEYNRINQIKTNGKL